MNGEPNLTLRARIARAAWVGWAGGTLVGLTEAWAILARNASETGSTLIGIVAAMGFVVALDGAIGALSLGGLGLLVAQVGRLRRRFADSPAWTSLCAAMFAGMLSLFYSLDRFGVLDETVTGLRAVVFAGITLIISAAIGALTYWLAHSVVGGQSNLQPHRGASQSPITKFARRFIAAIWIIAALLPLAYALIRSRLG